MDFLLLAHFLVSVILLVTVSRLRENYFIVFSSLKWAVTCDWTKGLEQNLMVIPWCMDNHDHLQNISVLGDLTWEQTTVYGSYSPNWQDSKYLLCVSPMQIFLWRVLTIFFLFFGVFCFYSWIYKNVLLWHFLNRCAKVYFILYLMNFK